MATNFRWEYLSATGYIDLFPETDIEAITDATRIFDIVAIDVDIPPASTLTQTVTITTDGKMEESPFRVFLNSTGDEAERDYSTIDNLQVTANTLTVTRAFNYPTGTISIKLVFFEKRGST